ncbi:MAG TPA: 2-isopropylmalate synthase [Candidatus Baltobacteraceae bacterium]|nr:2-isopropylmalate synthase [Candidatus Baltobacteraceae bacterium]
MAELRMKRVRIFDTTLRDGEQSPGAAMSPAARLRIAQLLADAGADVVEAGFPAASPAVAASVAGIARRVKGTQIAALARCVKSDIESAAHALRSAAAPRIHVFIATSPIHLQHKLRISMDRAIEMAVESVRFARNLCEDVEFSAEDATRTDLHVLCRMFSAVIAAGARTINIPDTVGYATPAEMQRLVSYVREHVGGIERACISVHTHDDLGMATANALASVSGGARQVECTVNGIGERAGNCALEEVVMALRTRADTFAAQTNFDPRAIRALSAAVARATRMPVQKNKSIVGANAFAHESGIHQDGVLKERSTYEIVDCEQLGVSTNLPLGRNSGRHGVMHRAERLGLRFAGAERDRFLEAFSRLAAQRRNVADNDLLQIAADLKSSNLHQ